MSPHFLKTVRYHAVLPDKTTKKKTPWRSPIYLIPKYIFPEVYTFKYTEGDKVSDLDLRIDLVIDIFWRVPLQKAYFIVRFV